MQDAPPAPRWLVWTNRAVLTLAGTVAAVMVAEYASASGEALDVALVAAVVAASAVAVLRPDRPVPVMVASLLSMLGLALVPPLWLLSLVPPLLLWTHRRRAHWRGIRHRAGHGDDDPYGPPDASDPDPRDPHP